VEPACVHNHLAVIGAGPFLAWPVAIELDTDAVRVVEVEGLADTVVGSAAEWPARVDQAPIGVGERTPAGVEDGVVIETGRARRRRRAAPALPGVEPDVVVVTAGADKGRLVAHAGHQLEAEDA